MNQEFAQAVAMLRTVNEEYAAARLSEASYALRRRMCLVEAAWHLARNCGVKLDRHTLGVNAEGDMVLATIAGLPFGKRLAKWLASTRARAGERGDQGIDEQSTWCRIHHLEVERLVFRIAEERAR